MKQDLHALIDEARRQIDGLARQRDDMKQALRGLQKEALNGTLNAYDWRTMASLRRKVLALDSLFDPDFDPSPDWIKQRELELWD